ncbi:MAG: hypothetical protein HON23_00025 [Rickettsiales bacterium]|jgi:hypothetical protein|nr:hypothetical protein [Rickettsiales bacterium]
MTDIAESKQSGSRKGRFIISVIILLIGLGLFGLYKYQYFFADKEVTITTIDDVKFESDGAEVNRIKSEITDVFQIKSDDIPVAISRNEVIRVEAGHSSLELAIKLDKLHERVELLESRLAEFNHIAVNIPNYQQLIITIIDLENAIKAGRDFFSTILKIKNITKDFYITSRIDEISRANFLKIYGVENLQASFTAGLNNYDSSLVLNNTRDNVWHKFLGDFIVIRKTGNFSGDAEDLVDQAEIFLREGHMIRAMDNLKLLDKERYEYFKEFITHTDNYLEALRLCAEIKSYLNL